MPVAVAYIGPSSNTTPTREHQASAIQQWSLQNRKPVIATFEDHGPASKPHLHRAAFEAMLQATRSKLRDFDTVVYNRYPFEEIVESPEAAAWEQISKHVEVVIASNNISSDPRIPRIQDDLAEAWSNNPVGAYRIGVAQRNFSEYVLNNTPESPAINILTEIAEMITSGEPPEHVAASLNQKGVIPPNFPSNRQWNEQHVIETITSEISTGQVFARVIKGKGKLDWYEIPTDPAILTQKLEDCKVHLDNVEKTSKYHGMFEELILCGACNEHYTSSMDRSGDHINYTCTKQLQDSNRNCPILKSTEVHQTILNKTADRMQELPELYSLAWIQYFELLAHGSKQAKLLPAWYHMALERQHIRLNQWKAGNTSENNRLTHDSGIDKALRAAEMSLGMLRSCQKISYAEFVRNMDVAISNRDHKYFGRILGRIIENIQTYQDHIVINYKTSHASSDTINITAR